MNVHNVRPPDKAGELVEVAGLISERGRKIDNEKNSSLNEDPATSSGVEPFETSKARSVFAFHLGVRKV